jgi:hypothetical protein
VPPKADFSTLGEIIPAYRQAQQQARQVAIQDVAKDLPDNPTFQDKLNVANRLFRLGDYAGATQLFTSVYAQNALERRQSQSQPDPLGDSSDRAPSVPANVPQFLEPNAQPQQPPQGPPQPVRNYGGDNVTVGAPQSVPDNMTTADALANMRQTGQAVPGGAVAAPAQTGPTIADRSPIVPRPVATVPGQMVQAQPVAPQVAQQPSPARRPQEISSAQLAQARQVARANPSVADAQLPDKWKGNPLGYVADQNRRGMEYDQRASDQEMLHLGSGQGERAQAQQFYKRANNVLDALAPTPEQRNAAASGFATPMAAALAQKGGEADIAARQAETQDTSKYLTKLTEQGVEAKEQSSKLNAVDTLGQKVGYGVIPKVQEYLGRFGINTEGLSDIQAYERAIDFLAPQLRPEGSGRLMAAELTSFKAALGGLMTTPQGRKISVQNLKLISDFRQKVGAVASDTSLTPSQRTAKIYALEAPKLQTTLLPIGSVRHGSTAKYRFNGGDPNDQASWTPITTGQEVARWQGARP